MISDGTKCHSCNHINSLNSKYCSNCGYILNVESVNKENKSTKDLLSKTKKIKSKKLYYFLIMEIVVAAILICTNPSKEMHLEFAKETMIKEINRQSPIAGGFFGLVDSLTGNTISDSMIKEHFTRRNFVLFSISISNFEGQKEIFAIGILGNMIRVDKLFH